MLKIYKNIAVFKKDIVDGNKPTHDLTISGEDFKNSTNAGALWTKDGAKGKFLAGTMKNEYTSDKGTFPGYVIVQEDELNALILKAQGNIDEDTGEKIPDLTDLQKINNETSQKLVGRDMTPEEMKSMEDMIF